MLIENLALKCELGRQAHEDMKQYSADIIWDKWEKLICELVNSTLQLLCGMTFIPAHSFQELHDYGGIFGSLGTISQTAKKYFLVYQLI